MFQKIRPFRVRCCIAARLTAALAFLLTGGLSCATEEPAVTDVRQVRQLPEEVRADLAPVAEGNNEFALALYGRLREAPGNLFLSPYSISTAMAMTWGGARGTTEEEMASALRFRLPQDRLHAVFAAIDRSLEAGAGLGGYRLDAANRLWGQSGFPFLPAFLSLTLEQYGAQLETLDFRGDASGSTARINRWVAEQTRQKIKDLLHPGDVNGDTRLVLTNAIYFKGKWDRPFDRAQTRNGPFTLASGEKADVPFMHQEASFRVTHEQDLSVLVLPYTGGDLEMVVLLPAAADGLPALESALTSERLSALVQNSRPTRVLISLPRFRFDSRFPLGAELKAMGMKTAFAPDAADFSGMDGRRDLFLSFVVHQAFVEVNEEGTEAAAATGVGVGVTSLPPVFTADHPFLFLIRDEVTGSILFIGRVVDPR